MFMMCEGCVRVCDGYGKVVCKDVRGVRGVYVKQPCLCDIQTNASYWP